MRVRREFIPHLILFVPNIYKEYKEPSPPKFSWQFFNWKKNPFPTLYEIIYLARVEVFIIWKLKKKKSTPRNLILQTTFEFFFYYLYFRKGVIILAGVENFPVRPASSKLTKWLKRLVKTRNFAFRRNIEQAKNKEKWFKNSFSYFIS